jgi:hypothetical protein
MTPMKSVEQLSSAMNEFLVPLRMGDGFLLGKFELVCNVVKELELEWKQQQMIPKSVAMIFIDAQAAMISSSYLYSSQTTDIQEKAEKLPNSSEMPRESKFSGLVK